MAEGAMGAEFMAFTSIPVIDVAALAGADRKAFESCAREIADACMTAGFFYIRNHGVPARVIEKAYEQARSFHSSPLELKHSVHVRHSAGSRGYVPTSTDERDDDPELYRVVELKSCDDDYLTRPQLFESFDLSLELREDDPDYRAGNILLVPNQWPDWLPQFRRDVTAYYDAVFGVGRRLFRAFAVALGLPDEFFNARSRKPPSQLRLLHYPLNDRPMDNTHMGIHSHSDFECFTILHQQQDGLQVMNAANVWVAAPPIDGTFIVNIGDCLEVWTNGLFKATQHRVVNTGQERFSLPLFFSADYHVVIRPLTKFVTANSPSAYEPFKAGEHLAGYIIRDTKHLRKKVLSGELQLEFPIHADNLFKRKAVNEPFEPG